MKEIFYLKKIFVIWAILLIVTPAITANCSNASNFQEKKISSTTTTDYFEDSIIIIIGKCNLVTGPLAWAFGFYIPLVKKSFLIKASGEEGEQLNILVRGDKFASYIDNENILVEFYGAKGILFWGQKSLITNSSRILVRCKAENIWVTYD